MCHITTLRDHQWETAMATVTEISWAMLLNDLELERRKYGLPHFVIVSPSLWVVLRCPLGTSRSNWRNTGRWQRWQTCNSTMGAIQNHRCCYFSFLWLLIQITRGRAHPVFTVGAPLISPVLTDEFRSCSGPHLYMLVASQLKLLSPASFPGNFLHLWV